MSCETTVLSLAVSNCAEWPDMPKAFIETPNGFVIPKATAEDPDLLKAFIQAAILDTPSLRVFVWPDFDTFDDVSEAKVRVNRPSGKTVPVRDGLKRFDIGYSISMCLHRAMFTHRRRNGRMIIILSSNKYLLNKRTDGDYQGYRISLLDTASLKLNTGAEPSTSPVFIELSDPNELDQHGYMVDASFQSELDILTDVTITQISGTTTVLKVTVLQTCDGTPVEGLVTLDFVVKKADGTSQTVTAAAVAGSPGTYTLTGTALVTGTVNLVAPDALSIQAYDAGITPTVVTVPFP